ncbi:MAG TPA: hypothetical protein VFW11_13255 [Cyclobacteriaceae bacterium]|nr:hypothetical protein [Cyclobacteriaceae bacterium]
MKTILLTTIIIGLITGVDAQTFTEKSTKEFTFSKSSPNNTLMVLNINGSIEVKGYKGDKIIVETEKTIHAKTESQLERAKEKLAFGYKDLSDTLILYIDGLCYSFGKQKDHNNSDHNGWGYNWQNCHDGDGWVKDESFDYTMNFTIQVPEGISVVASTINNGDVTVLDVKGEVVANNINGSIKLDHLLSKAIAHTINGNLDLSYDVNPSDDCRFYTLNGNINADFSKGLAANLSFESFNGEFYTNLEQMELLPVTVEKVDNKPGVRYKIKGNRYKIRNGGANLDFETFNGDVYLKERK